MNMNHLVSTSTQRQQLLLEELQRCETEMSGQQLHRCLEGQPGAMGLATVYRNLRKLQQQGKVRCRHLPTGEALYAPVERDQHHIVRSGVEAPGAVHIHHLGVPLALAGRIQIRGEVDGDITEPESFDAL